MLGALPAAGFPNRGKIRRVYTMLAVRDLERSVAFYRDNFGFTVDAKKPWIALLRLDAFLLYLFTAGPPTADKPGVFTVAPADEHRASTIVCFEVADVRQAYERLEGRGVHFLTPPKRPPWGGSRCFAFDPDGHLLEIETTSE